MVQFNKKLQEYKIDFPDGSSDFVAPGEVNGINVVELAALEQSISTAHGEVVEDEIISTDHGKLLEVEDEFI